MKKLVLLLMCLALVIASPAVLAGDFEGVGGMTFNTFDVEHKYPDGYVEGMEDYIHGNGMYVGGRYWFNDKLAAGLGYDYINTQPCYYYEYESYENEYGMKMDLQGLYGELVYKLTDHINIKGALANYTFTGKYYSEESTPLYYDESEEFEGSGMGYLFGAEMNYPLTDSLELNSMLGYRSVSLDMEEFFYIYPDSTSEDMSIDLNGVCFSIGLNYAF